MKATDIWEHAATVAIVACGVVLSIVWALAVPIFQNPDEEAHYDYVLGLRTAGRPLLAREGRATMTDDPAFNYLEVAAGLTRIAFQPTSRVDADYGSPAWIARVDRAAPPLDPSSYRKPGHALPALVTTYPPGYYALAALWMAAAQQIRPGLVEGFFSVRFFSVFVFGLTLLASASLMRELRIEKATRMILLAALALFPLCTFVSASIQPDVLVGLFLTLLAHRCAVYRRAPTWPNALLIASLLIGCCLVKPLYTLPGLAAFLLLAVGAAASRPRFARSVALHAAIAVVGFGLAYGLDQFVSYQPAILRAVSSRPVLDASQPAAALARGVVPFAGYVSNTLTGSILDFFFDGGTQSSYLGRFGWLDAPLRFFVPELDLWGFAAAFAFRLVVAGLGVLTLMMVVWRCTVLARHSRRRALGLLLNDVPLTLLLIYDALILALALITPKLGYQGRYWYPVVVVSMIASVRYGPRLIPFVRERIVLQRALALWLCAWSLIASHGAAHTIRARYYAFTESSPATSPRLALALDAPDRSRRARPGVRLWRATGDRESA